MKYYPIFLRVAGRPCLVVGGGTVAEHKVDALLRAGARVTVISPELTSKLASRAADGSITYHRRRYVAGDLHGAALAYAATDDAALHRQMADDAAAAGVLLNVVDHPGLCDFIAPAVMQRGDLLIATSTSGASPAMAKRIRRNLEQTFGPEYADALQILACLRRRLAERALSFAERQRILGALVDSSLVEYLRDGRTDEVDRLLAATVGDGVSLASLGMERTA